MSRQHFTEEQVNQLRKNPYVYSVTPARLTFTKEFKELFLDSYNKGELPRFILENHGFDIQILGERRVWGISQRIREEYQKYGEVNQGYTHRSPCAETSDAGKQILSDKEQIRQLQHRVEYLEQQMEFLKKISSIRSIRK